MRAAGLSVSCLALPSLNNIDTYTHTNDSWQSWWSDLTKQSWYFTCFFSLWPVTLWTTSEVWDLKSHISIERKTYLSFGLTQVQADKFQWKNIYGSQHAPVEGIKTGIERKVWFWNWARGGKLQAKHSSEGEGVNFDMVRGHLPSCPTPSQEHDPEVGTSDGNKSSHKNSSTSG